jgi:hypothetical protein
MSGKAEVSIVDHVIELAHEIIDECPSRAARASEIIVWVEQVRERRPSRDELAALVDATCQGALTDTQRANLIEGLHAIVRFAE